MAKIMQYEVLDDTTPEQKPEVFKAKYKEVDGKKQLVVEVRCEQIVHPDGRKDMIIHAPTLDLMNKFQNENQ